MGEGMADAAPIFRPRAARRGLAGPSPASGRAGTGMIVAYFKEVSMAEEKRKKIRWMTKKRKGKSRKWKSKWVIVHHGDKKPAEKK